MGLGSLWASALSFVMGFERVSKIPGNMEKFVDVHRTRDPLARKIVGKRGERKE